MVKTNDIDQFNKGKRIKFDESVEARRTLRHATYKVDKVYVGSAHTLSKTW